MGTWLQWNTSSSLIALCSMVCRHCGLNMEAGSPPSLPSLSQQAGEATSCFASSSRTEAPETGTMHIPPAESNFHKRWEAPVVQLHIRQGGGGGGDCLYCLTAIICTALGPHPSLNQDLWLARWRHGRAGICTQVSNPTIPAMSQRQPSWPCSRGGSECCPATCHAESWPLVQFHNSLHFTKLPLKMQREPLKY